MKKGYLEVGQGHEIYYEACGNEKGGNVLYLHGGPGAGFSNKDKAYFNLKKYRAIFLDQRGSGRSKPFASLKANTTDHLIKDINLLLDHLNVKKVFLFGGSWGSTLALAYAIKNPKRVKGMLLRGIFLGTSKELDFFYTEGLTYFFPEVKERFFSLIPKKHRKRPVKYYLNQMKSGSSKKIDKFAYEWANHELSVMMLYLSEADRKKFMKMFNYKALSPLECHYLANECFMPKNYIMKNIKKISHLPTSIVQGRYDMVCPPLSAFQLHKKLKKSKLFIETAGHTAHEKPIHKRLVSEMKKYEKILK